MEKFTLVIPERGTGRSWRRTLQSTEIPKVGETVDLCPRLPFGRREVSRHEEGRDGIEVLFEDFEPQVFDKFGDYLYIDSEWQFVTE